MPHRRHCERSEAIQEYIRGGSLDCFASLAMAEEASGSIKSLVETVLE